MTEAILKRLADYMLRTAKEGEDDLLVILPNRRAGLFLQRYLSESTLSSMWMPRVSGIGDFIEAESELRLSDPVELQFRLYDIYSTMVEEAEPLDQFMPWGEMMIRDFDELDKYLLDAEQLFQNIRDLKALEEPLAGLEPEQLVFIRQFWEGFYEGDMTPEKRQFLQTWELLPRLYKKLQEELRSAGEGYQGMQYRELAERILKGEHALERGGRTIVAGFNALNRCEKVIFSALREHGAAFFWDYDQRYLEDGGEEAGRFLRENIKRFPEAEKLEDFRGLDMEKQFRVFELPTDVLQSKTVYHLLKDEDPARLSKSTDTALVLCDEELLLPVLMSLPDGVEEVNITMGYPMKNTPVFSFLDSLLRLHYHVRKKSDGSARFYHKDVNDILQHPYFRKMRGEDSGELSKRILSENMYMIDRELFTGELELMIFRPLENAAALLDYLRWIFSHLLELIAGRENHHEDVLDREFCFQLLKQVNKLERMNEGRSDISFPLMERLLRRSLQNLRIPFEGEPLAGMQIMGILETRMLDFKHVILLSMNEEVMPAQQAAHSHIPYSLRLAFGLPSREEMDAIYAYYFYRLLQRAERVDILFNGSTEGVSTGEMSRYAKQLIFEKDLEVIRPGLNVKAREISPIIVEHSEEASQKLMRYLQGSEEDRYLSPSAINTYIDCSLKYYFRYIAGLGEMDEISEDIDASGFGTVVHDSLNELYLEIARKNGGIISKEALQDLLSSGRYESQLKEQFIKHHYKGRRKESIEGRNILIFSVMLRYMKQVLEQDSFIAPFELVAAEETYRRNLSIEVGGKSLELSLGGKIDRIDRVKGQLRVIDYKTGRTDQKFRDVESLFDGSYGSRNSAALQTLFYAWLVGEIFSGKNAMPGLYSMKGLFEEKFDPALHMTSLKKEGRVDSFSPMEEQFLHELKEVLQQLFDSRVPFVQRAYDKKCGYCDFASLCQRKTID